MSDEMPIDAWIGQGPAFPFRPGPEGRLAYATGDAVIRQSVETVLDTEPGERVMLPTFGCGLRRFLMRPNTPATRASMQQEISGSLARWEPRIQVTDVSVSPGDDPALVWITIRYTQLADRREDDLVYPFYLR
ncbi:GPW/gp25 family protein [Streptomyces kanamyceticus]|uniref:Baseplate assembly protein n=1 Tax=Streptomyces kanamyceticus TaxID=1967 RepID=A0A5J6GQD9_STRKN|nr:GPW/gp25 family protein [Streptomyces kanamyceticus]QEU96632.1 baseplate assembly protein [Streptomyces kanamyceticus]